MIMKNQEKQHVDIGFLRQEHQDYTKRAKERGLNFVAHVKNLLAEDLIKSKQLS